MELAEEIKKRLGTKEAETEKYKLLERYSQRAWAIFHEMEEVEKERIPLYQDYETGKSVKKNMQRKRRDTRPA